LVPLAAVIPVAWLAGVVHSWLPQIEIWLDASFFPFDISTLAAFVTGLFAAAVLLWRRDAWRSAPLVLLGAIVGTLVPRAVDIALQLSFHFASDGDQSWPTWIGYAQLVVGLVSVAGPLLMAIGLDRCRTAKARTRWRRSVVAAALIVVALMGGRSLAVFLGNAVGEFDPVVFWLWAAQSALHPLSIAFVLAITWCSLSALRDGELPRRFWRLAFLGSGAMCVSSIVIWILSDPIARPFVESEAYQQGSTLNMLVGLAGAVMLLLAFLVPLFEEDRSLAEPGPLPGDGVAFGPA